MNQCYFCQSGPKRFLISDSHQLVCEKCYYIAYCLGCSPKLLLRGAVPVYCNQFYPANFIQLPPSSTDTEVCFFDFDEAEVYCLQCHVSLCHKCILNHSCNVAASVMLEFAGPQVAQQGNDSGLFAKMFSLFTSQENHRVR